MLLWDHIPTLVPPYVRGTAAGLAHREVRGENLRLQASLDVQRQLAFHIAWQTLIMWHLGGAAAQQWSSVDVAARQHRPHARGSQFTTWTVDTPQSRTCKP